MRDRRDAQLLALLFRHPRDGLEPGSDRTPPVELARTPHPRFGSAADDPVARFDNDVSMKDDDSEDEERPPRPVAILSAGSSSHILADL